MENLVVKEERENPRSQREKEEKLEKGNPKEKLELKKGFYFYLIIFNRNIYIVDGNTKKL